MKFSDIKQLLKLELAACQNLLLSACKSNLPVINQITNNLIPSNSKLLRPLLTLLTAAMLGYQGSGQYNIAAALELIHTATLLHDDVIDHAMLRRGNSTANYQWGNEIAVLTGDWLLTTAMDLLTELNNLEIIAVVAKTTKSLVTGELSQFVNRNNIDLDEKTYLNIITAKTANLFALATKLPALLVNGTETTKIALTTYGLHLGIAFQLIDDALDYQAIANSQLGKATGQDFAEGNLTLPIIYLLNNGTTAEKHFIKRAFSNKNQVTWQKLQTIIASSGAIAYTIERAKQEADLAKIALSTLSASVHQEAAYCLVDFIISRNY